MCCRGIGRVAARGRQEQEDDGKDGLVLSVAMVLHGSRGDLVCADVSLVVQSIVLLSFWSLWCVLVTVTVRENIAERNWSWGVCLDRRTYGVD